MDAQTCEELLQAGRNQHIQALMKTTKDRSSPSKRKTEVIRIRNKFGFIPTTPDLGTIRSLTVRSSPRKRTDPFPRHMKTASFKKSQGQRLSLRSRLHRHSFIKYLDEVSSDDSLPPNPTPDSLLMSETPLQPQSPVKDHSPQYRTPSVESSNRPTSIYSIGPRKPLYNLDSMESPFEDRYDADEDFYLQPHKPTPQPQKKPVIRTKEVKDFEWEEEGSDLYLFRKVPGSKLPARRLRKLSGFKRMSMDMSRLPKEELWAFSSFLYPTSSTETVVYSASGNNSTKAGKLKKTQRRCAGNLGTVRVKTVLPSPVVLAEP